ncbi:hypothetical protein V8C86DRAFT_3124935 [Haematococcus lacustris]
MAPDWGRFVNNANAQAPTPATSTGPAKVTELTYHLLNRGYFPFEDIDPREAVDVWIGLVGSNGPMLADVATLVCWYQAPLEDMLKLNGASSVIMLKNIRSSAMHGMFHGTSGLRDMRMPPMYLYASVVDHVDMLSQLQGT